jgi:hypothetical protein
MRRYMLAIIALVAGSVGSARADISYQYVTDQSTYSGTAGSSITVNFYLQENGANPSNGIINNDNGLFGAGFLATQTNVSGGSAGSTFTVGSLQFNKNDPASGSPQGFGSGGLYSNKPNTTTQQGGLENIFTGTVAPFTSNIGALQNVIFLGSASIVVGPAGTSTTFTLTSYKSFNHVDGNTLTNNSGFDLDVTSSSPAYIGADNNPFTFTVAAAAAPEPSSILLCGLAACGGALSVYRRRTSQRTPVAPA